MTNHEDLAVQFVGVGKRYPNGFDALREINLNITRGDCVTLLGTSGSGKSTLLRMINGLVEPTEGEVTVRGRSVRDWDRIALRRSIGYVIQEAGLLQHLSVLENAALVPRLLGARREDARRRAEELLTMVGLDPQRHAPRLPRELSGGERQRVGLARALAADPDLMLMDEPFGALDPLTRRELQAEFDSLRRRLGKTVVLVTHDVREACRLGDRIVVLHDGKIVADDAPEVLLKVRADPFVAEFFRDADAITTPTGEARA
jgi:osmoprotectant transport system ATP-binding protein